MSVKRNHQLKHKISEELSQLWKSRKKVVSCRMEDLLKFDCLIFHHVSGLIMTHITRFEGYHEGAVEDSILLWCDALGIVGTVLFRNVGKSLTRRRSFTSQKTWTLNVTYFILLLEHIGMFSSIVILIALFGEINWRASHWCSNWVWWQRGVFEIRNGSWESDEEVPVSQLRRGFFLFKSKHN